MFTWSQEQLSTQKASKPKSNRPIGKKQLETTRNEIITHARSRTSASRSSLPTPSAPSSPSSPSAAPSSPSSPSAPSAPSPKSGSGSCKLADLCSEYVTFTRAAEKSSEASCASGAALGGSVPGSPSLPLELEEVSVMAIRPDATGIFRTSVLTKWIKYIFGFHRNPMTWNWFVCPILKPKRQLFFYCDLGTSKNKADQKPKNCSSSLSPKLGKQPSVSIWKLDIPLHQPSLVWLTVAVPRAVEN